VTRDPRFDCLFEPVKIGPVVAKNRFYQLPHCNGMGHARPQSHAAMRGICDIPVLANLADAIHRHGPTTGMR